MGVIHLRGRNELSDDQNDCTIRLAMNCTICRYGDLGRGYDPFENWFPHHIHYLRQHVAQYHPESRDQFELGWSRIPPALRKVWSFHGNTKWGPHNTISWNGWGNAVREMLSSVVYSKQPEFRDIKSAWRQYFRGSKVYALPDIVPAIEPQNQIPPADDMSLLLEAFYVMREWSAINEFAAKWNSPDRENLWNEIVGFWGFGEIYPVPPTIIQPVNGWEQ